MHQNSNSNQGGRIRDYGSEPFIVDIDRAAQINQNFRTAIWTGSHLQLTLMCIPVGGEIGLEVHEDTDQFIRIEDGHAIVSFGKTRNTVKNVKIIDNHFAVAVPAGTWHNIINCGNGPLRLYSIYAPPHHPFGAVQQTKESPEI